MVKPFSALPNVLDARVVRMQKNLTKIVRETATVGNRALILGTPVDKGVARSNWITALNLPNLVQIPAYAPGNKLGIAEKANAEAAMAQGAAAINRFNSIRNVAIFMSNIVPYIGKLNRGHSRLQAPAGMIVEKAFMKMRRAVRGKKVLD